MINGRAWKALIEEEFGDGMSGIDFDVQIERLPNPKGDRVKITMSGKFLPYKYYGNVPERYSAACGLPYACSIMTPDKAA